MNIKEIRGYVNGKEIASFLLLEDGKWQATIPAQAFGEYNLELYAVDLAGNVTYYAEAFFFIRPKGIETEIILKLFNVNEEMKDINLIKTDNKFYIENILEEKYSLETLSKDYSIEYVELCKEGLA